MRNNKLILMSLVVILIFVFAGCSKNDDVSKNDSTSPFSYTTQHTITITAFEDSGNKLPNVSFKIIKGNESISSLTTDNSGNATSSLPSGKYYFQIDSVPDGYIVDDTLYDFEISEYDVEIEIEVEKEE